MSSDLSELKLAYATTTFRVFAPEQIVDIFVDQHSEQLERILRQYRVGSWAFITAQNPASQLMSPEQNAERQLQLGARLSALGLTYWHGAGIGTDPQWQPEESMFILGISQEQAFQIGCEFGQNCVVFGHQGQLPFLLWCVAEEPS